MLKFGVWSVCGIYWHNLSVLLFYIVFGQAFLWVNADLTASKVYR